MLQAKPVGLFSPDFKIEAEGREISYLDLGCWREAGEIQVQDKPYRLSREGLMSGAFVLETEGWPVARATKPSAFRSFFELEIDSRRYSLTRASMFTRAFSVLDGDSEVGRIRPAGFLSRRALIQLPAEWPQAVQIFVFWLVVIIWNRDEASS